MKNVLKSLGIGFVLSLGLAFAHSELESSSPPDGSVLAAAPKQIVLNFAEEAQIAFSTFKVYPLPLSPEAAAMMEAEPITETMFDPDGGADEMAASAEGEHSEGEEHSEEATGEHSDTAGSSHSASDTAQSDASSTHEVMDTVAEEFIPTVIDVTDDEMARADTGVVEKDTSKTVTLNLKDGLAPGAYVVMWRVLSVDTHTVEGSLTFFVK
jgi:methionine-rich copper-binding protein CopC